MVLAPLGLLLVVLPDPCYAVQRLDLDLASEEWETSTQGAFAVRLDRRHVLTMSHSDTPAAPGDHAAVSRVVDLPEGRKGPLVLRFYLTDDYCGDKQQATYFRDAVKERVADWKEEVRFCEVRLDDVVVWSGDVIGRNGTTAGERFCDLEISELVAKKAEVKLAFRVRDEADTGPASFATDVFWARAELLWDFGDAPPPVEFPPPLPFRREKFRPTAPPAPPSGTTTLTVRNPSGVALPAWPIRWGVPLPQGAITKATQLALAGPDGKPVTLEAEVAARWPDGSAKWVLLDFVAPLVPGNARFTFQYGAAVTGAEEAPQWQPRDPEPPDGRTLIADAGGGERALVVQSAGDGKMRRLAVRTESLSEMTFADEAGRVVARGELQSWHYAIEVPGQSVRFVRFTLEAGGQAEGLKVRRLVVHLSPRVKTSRTGIDGTVVEVTGPWSIRQEGENAITGTGGIEARPGHWDGWVFAEGLRQDMILLRRPWQQYPIGFATDEECSSLRLLDVPDGQPPIALAPGEAKSWEYMGWAGQEGLSAEQAATLNAVYQKPPVVVLEPGWLAATNALGPFLEQDERRFPEYEAAAARVAPGVLGQREQQKAYGWESFGDLQFGWGFGEALTYWQNTEYDYAHALLWQFLRTGDPDCFYAGEQAAMHYRDVDLIHANDAHPDWIGGAHHHSETHTGHGPSISHHWTEGLYDHWLLTGDARSLECAGQAAGYAARVALASGYGGGERDAGWNLIALMGAYRATGDGALLQAATKKVEDVLAYLDPVRGVSSAPIYEQTAYEGGTPFMAAILMRGLVAYYEATRDERVGWAICGLCDWMECEMMPSPGRFYYKQTPQCHSVSPQLLAVDGTAFAWNFSGDPAYRRLALDVYRQGVGGAGLTNMRDMPHALALLATALPPVALASVERPLLAVRSPETPPTSTFRLRNLSGEAESVEIRLGQVGKEPAFATTVEAPDAPGETPCAVALPLREGEGGVQRFTYAVACGSEEVARGELATVIVPRVPRVLLLAPEDNLTTRALSLLDLPCERTEVQSLTPELLAQADVLIAGFDVDRAPLEEYAEALREWVRGGGVILGFRDNSGHTGWLPSPVSQDASYQPGELLQPDAAPFSLLHEIAPDTLRAVHGGSMYAAFYDLGDGWTPLAAAGAKQPWDKAEPKSDGPHYGLIELRLGQGRVILSQLIPEYAWLNDDSGAQESAGRLLLENLLAYACLAAR